MLGWQSSSNVIKGSKVICRTAFWRSISHSEGAADLLTLEMAAVTIRKEVKENKGDCIVRGCVFDIPSSELSSYFEREHRYIPVEVEITDEKVSFIV